MFFFFFFFNDTATTEIYTLSLHDALPISTRTAQCAIRVDSGGSISQISLPVCGSRIPRRQAMRPKTSKLRSEEHTSELQSHLNLVCRLLLEKKKKTNNTIHAKET